MTIHGESEKYWQHVGEKQPDAIQAQHVNIELQNMCIDKSSNKELLSTCQKKDIFFTHILQLSFATYYSPSAAIIQTLIRH